MGLINEDVTTGSSYDNKNNVQLLRFWLEFRDLAHEECDWLSKWIAFHLEPAATWGCLPDTYGLKHRYQEASGGFYTTHGALTIALFLADIEVRSVPELNLEGTSNWEVKAKWSKASRAQQQGLSDETRELPTYR